MRIDAATIAAHRFGTVRRRGYDPDEVDAVMARLAETLRDYESSIADLQTRLAEAHESAEAVQRTYLAAVKTRDEMIGEGEAAAVEIRRHAFEEAQQAVTEARAGAQRIEEEALASTSAARDLVDAARGQAEAIAAAARAEAEAAARHAEDLLGKATDTAAARIAAADEAARATQEEAQRGAGRTALQAAGDAAAIRTEAERHAAERREQAAAEAAAIVVAARQEAVAALEGTRAEQSDLEAHLANLRQAIATIEDDLRAAAELALSRFASVSESLAITGTPPGRDDDALAKGRFVVDLTDMALKNGNATADADSMSDLHWDDATLIEMFASRPAGLIARPDGSGLPPADRDVIDLATVRSATGSGTVEDRGPDTIYQRRSGGLKRRLGTDSMPHGPEGTASGP